MAPKRGREARGSASLAKIRALRRPAARLLQVLAACIVIVLGTGAVVALVDEDSWPAGQLQAVAALSVTERTPVLAWIVRVVTAEPRAAETVVGGARSTVVRPGEGDRWPAVVFVNGATRYGRHHPKVQRLANGLARVGFLVVVPDLPGLRLGEITTMTAAATTRVAVATADRPDVRGGRVGLYGVSVGASLALLAAERSALASRVSVVGGEAPWTDMRRIIRLATTGYYDGARYSTDPYAWLAIGRSLAAGLPPTSGRRPLLRTLESIADDDSNPSATLAPARYRGETRALVDLVLNTDPRRFDELYGRLPALLRTRVEALSPLRHARRLRAPVELASSPHDKYFPPAESRALDRVAPRVHVTVTTTLDHAVPRPSLRDLRDLFRFDGFVIRFLRATRS
jgi:pimeloyl-ACP methyl ester carboxylesterase